MNAILKLALFVVGFLLTFTPLIIVVRSVNEILATMFSIGASILTIDWFGNQIYLIKRIKKLEEK